MRKFLDLVGQLGSFAWLAVRRAFVPPFEMATVARQLDVIGWQSLALVTSSGFAVGLVLTLHTRSSLTRFGAAAMVPTVQSLSFFNEIGPLVTGLLVAGRAGAGIGAELANMRVTEQIDAVEALSVDSFKLLVVPRIIACIISLPLLTVFMDAAGILGGLLVEKVSEHFSFELFLNRAFSQVTWASFLPPTFKTCIFGLIIGLVSSFYGFTTDEGSVGVGRASTRSVVLSSLLIILADVILVKIILLIFPDTAI